MLTLRKLAIRLLFTKKGAKQALQQWSNDNLAI